MNSLQWQRRLPKENPDLLRLIHDFNHRPQHWINPTVMDSVAYSELALDLTSCSHGGNPSLWVARQLGLLETAPWWDFQEPRRRIALLSYETLERLAIICGVAQRWARIASIIGREQIRELKAAIGERAHAFALRRGRLVVSQQTASQSLPGQTLIEEIRHLGWNTVLSALNGEPEPLMFRFGLKLPDTVSVPEPAAIDETARDSAWQRIRKVSKEVFTEGELRCFA